MMNATRFVIMLALLCMMPSCGGAGAGEIGVDRADDSAGGSDVSRNAGQTFGFDTSFVPRVEGFDDIVVLGQLGSSIITLDDPMMPAHHYVVGPAGGPTYENKVYLNSFLEPAQSIPQGDDTTVIDLTGCESDGWPSIAVPAGTQITMRMHCIPGLPSEEPIKVLFAGDSLTAGHPLLLDEQIRVIGGWTTITYIGTKFLDPIWHEGTGGQTWKRHVTDPVLSAFVDASGTLNIRAYFAAQGTPDLVFLVGGSNDVFALDSEAPGWDASLAEAMGYLEEFVQGFLDADSRLEIVILCPPTPNPNLAAYNGYATDFPTWRKTHRAYVEEVNRRFGRRSGRIEVLGSYMVMDRANPGVWGIVDPVHPTSLRTAVKAVVLPRVVDHALRL